MCCFNLQDQNVSQEGSKWNNELVISLNIVLFVTTYVLLYLDIKYKEFCYYKEQYCASFIAQMTRKPELRTKSEIEVE
jgi:hypothetical protein